MTVSNFKDAFNNSSKSVFFLGGGPSIPQFKWNLKQTISEWMKR